MDLEKILTAMEHHEGASFGLAFVFLLSLLIIGCILTELFKRKGK